MKHAAPLIKPTEASLATARLRQEILSGAVRPGTKLKLVPLADRYQVSRGPVREAATRLAAEGLVSIEDQRGFRVTALSREDLLDLTETRTRIELLTLRDAIAAGDLDWEGRVMAACHTLERVHEDPGADFTLRHAEFHEALVSACPHRYLLEFRARLFALSQRYRNLAARGADRAPRDVAAEHHAIAAAAVARRPEDACGQLAEHLERTARRLIEAYPALFGEAQ